MDGWMDKWMVGWMDGRMDGSPYIRMFFRVVTILPEEVTIKFSHNQFN